MSTEMQSMPLALSASPERDDRSGLGWGVPPVKPADPSLVFSRDDDADGVNLADDPKIALLAACIVNQQVAGFKKRVDLRQVSCVDCGAPGFNTGWGYWRYLCGAEILSDGEPSAPCPKQDPA